MKKFKSEAEQIVATIEGVGRYEPYPIWYTAKYIPDFVTPQGTVIEVKEWLDVKEKKRIQEVHDTLTRRRELFIVLVYIRREERDYKPTKGGILRGEQLLAFLSESGIKSIKVTPSNSEEVRQVLRTKELEHKETLARYASDYTGSE